MKEFKDYMLTTLAKNPEYFDETIALIEKEFHYSKENSFAVDFYPLVNPLNFENSFILIDKNNNIVVSHIAISMREMIKDNHQLPIGFLGGIATHKEYRNRGLFKNLLNFIIEEKKSECALFILWSELTGLYEKFNFSLSGGVIETGKSVFTHNNRPVGFTKTKFNQLSAFEFETIIELYENFNQKKFFTVKRDIGDWNLIREMNSVDLYIKKDEEQIIEYFCINKGRDLNNIIHEISCLPERYKGLLKILSPYKTWLPEDQKILFPPSEIFFNCYIKMGNEKKIKNFIESVTDNEVILKEINETHVFFKFQDQDYEVTHQNFFLYVFGPNPIKEFEKYALSPYICGCDSV